MVTDGRYCALGTKEELVIDYAPCKNLDETEPELTVLAGLITSNSIQVIAQAKDDESAISGYQYSKDNGKTWTEVIETNSYTFTKLKNGTSFDIKVRAINGNNLKTEKGIKLKTLDIPLPTYTSNPGLATWSKSKVVTIHYPERKSNFIYEYSIDNAKTWIEVATGITKDVTFTSNGNLTARIRDGYNVNQAATLTITTIDVTSPTIPTSVIRYDSSTGSVRGSVDSWTNKILWWGEFKSTDTGSGIDHYEYSDGCTGSKTGNLNSSYTYSADMNKRYCIRAVDKLGNASGWSSVNYFKVDRTNPTCGTMSLSGTKGNNGWYRSIVTVNKTNGSDALSGHASTTITTSSIGDTNGTKVTLTTKDNAGNVCTTTSDTIKVDTKAPQNITVYVKSSSSYYNKTNITVNVPYTSSFCTSGSQYGLSTYNANDGGSPITFYHNYSSTSRCPNGTPFNGCRTGETHTRKAFSPTSVIADYFAGTAGNHNGYYTGYSTGIYTIWAEDAAGNRSNEAKITMNFCTK